MLTKEVPVAKGLLDLPAHTGVPPPEGEADVPIRLAAQRCVLAEPPHLSLMIDRFRVLIRVMADYSRSRMGAKNLHDPLGKWGDDERIRVDFGDNIHIHLTLNGRETGENRGCRPRAGTVATTAARVTHDGEMTRTGRGESACQIAVTDLVIDNNYMRYPWLVRPNTLQRIYRPLNFPLAGPNLQ